MLQECIASILSQSPQAERTVVLVSACSCYWDQLLACSGCSLILLLRPCYTCAWWHLASKASASSCGVLCAGSTCFCHSIPSYSRSRAATPASIITCWCRTSTTCQCGRRRRMTCLMQSGAQSHLCSSCLHKNVFLPWVWAHT